MQRSTILYTFLQIDLTTSNYFDYEYDFFGTTKFLTGVRKIVVGSNLTAVLLFNTRAAEDLVVNITSSKAKKSYS